jgi:hypothetical protein
LIEVKPDGSVAAVASAFESGINFGNQANRKPAAAMQRAGLRGMPKQVSERARITGMIR